MKHTRTLNKSIAKFLQSKYKENTSLKEYLIAKGIENFHTITEFSQRSWPFWVKEQLFSNTQNVSPRTNFFSLINDTY